MAENDQGLDSGSLGDADSGLARRTVATYNRVIQASIERIWENVLDWEHLPWLHSGSFASIELEHEDEYGWRAMVGVGPKDFASTSLIQVSLDRPNSCYTTSTLSGLGEGTEIRTALAPVSKHETEITVDFNVPGISDEDADAVGAIYLDLYSQLWDEDETMMQQRQSMLDARANRAEAETDEAAAVALGSEPDLRTRLPLLVEVGRRRYRVVDMDGTLLAHDVVCPHLGGPLEDSAVDDDGAVTCPWHGYRFDVRSGEGVGGCNLRLRQAPRVSVDDATREVTLSFS